MKKNFLLVLAASILILIIVSFLNFGKSGNGKVQEDEFMSCATNDFTGQIVATERLAIFEGKKIEVPTLAFQDDQTDILGVASDERWIEVDLSEQKLRAWEGENLFLETKVSTGLPFTPTPQGEFRIWIKLRATKMSGGSGRNYYYLPNVPYVMYFENAQVPAWRGYGLHGTYWHNDFGRPRSHGCVNLPTPIAEQLYYWVGPVLPDAKTSVRASANNPGTRIVIHE